MLIQHREDARGGEFFIEEHGERVAELTYQRDGSTLVILHTGVDDRLGGQGVGRKLMAAAVDFARERGDKLQPVCSFARAVLDKTPDWEDVRA